MCVQSARIAGAGIRPMETFPTQPDQWFCLLTRLCRLCLVCRTAPRVAAAGLWMENEQEISPRNLLQMISCLDKVLQAVYDHWSDGLLVKSTMKK